jgi:hypothetical protein
MVRARLVPARYAALCLPLFSLYGAFACGGEDAATTTTTTSSSSSSSTSSGGGGGGGDVMEFYSPPPDSCAYDCPNLAACAENKTPYACPSLGKWDAIPHAPECNGWDGKYPTPTAGKCSASAPAKDALKKSGKDPDDANAWVLPDGRRVHPAGHEWVFPELGGLTSNAIDVPGTPFLITVDTGSGDHVVRVIDTTKLSMGADPVVGHVEFPAPQTLNSAIAFASPTRLLVASDEGVLHALSFDPATGALALDDAHAITLPMNMKGNIYASGVAASPDGAVVAVTSLDEKTLHLYSLANDATYGKELGSVNVGAPESFGIYFDPLDSHTAYVSLWADKKVVAVDLTNPAAPVVKTSFKVAKNPEQITFLDARYMAVATANGDSVCVIDRTANQVTSVPIDAGSNLHGAEPSTLAFDAAASRLYVTLGGDNAVVAFDIDLAASPPKLTRTGALGAGWWPSSVVVRASGDVAITTLRGHGGGPIPLHFPYGDSDIGDRMRGSVQFVSKPSKADLSAGEAQLTIDNAVNKLSGAPAISCPQGAMDFPVPATNTEGPSKVIDHVFFLLRENKDFDAIFGDLQGVDGEPTYTLTGDTKSMDAIWHNMRTLARTYAMSDAYYTDAVFSTQGHVWATFARSSDFNERTWILSGDRHGSPRSVPGGGVTPVGQPEEGSLFDWLYHNKVPFNILGEIDGQPTLPPDAAPVLDIHYPGVAQDIGLIDLPKACYSAGRYRVACNIGNFVYQTLPNDHTLGVSPNRATPATMCAVNDEATGMTIDAITHSPYWKSSIIFITEDDPSQGGEHVDGHRAPLVVISPWAKRKYISKTHMDMASIHKIYAHVFGLPYPNRQVANAALPLDLFTSTPDYTPYDYVPRTEPLACGAGAQGPVPPVEAELTNLWDFSEEDQQPGLGAQVVRFFRNRPATAIEPGVRERLIRWNRRATRRKQDGDDD